MTTNMNPNHTPSITESGGSPPNEKAHAQDERNELLAKLPDPDAGKSDEERAAIVCVSPITTQPHACDKN